MTTPSGESASDHESDPEAMPWGRVRLALISGHALDGMAHVSFAPAIIGNRRSHSMRFALARVVLVPFEIVHGRGDVFN